MMMEEDGSNVGGLPPPARHPLVLPCIAVVAGCFLGLRHPQGTGFCITVCGVLVVAWVILIHAAGRRNHRLVPASWTLVFLVGAVAFAWASLVARQRAETREILDAIVDQGGDVVVCGRVVNDPACRVLKRGGARLDFVMDVREVVCDDVTARPAPARLEVDWYGPRSMQTRHASFRTPVSGEGWQLGGRLKEVPTRSPDPLFVLQVRKAPGINRHRPDCDGPTVVRRLGRLRRQASRILSMGVGEHARAVSIIQAMTLGLRASIPPEVMDVFRLSGTVHVFAISGLHVGIVAALLMKVLSLLPIQGRWRVLVFGPLIIAYTIGTGAKPSAVRACIMSLFFFSGSLLDRRADPVSSLCAAAMLILAINPTQVRDLGFVFSFACATGIILLVPVFSAALSRLGMRMINGVRRVRPPSEQEPGFGAGSTTRAVWAGRVGPRLLVRMEQACAVSLAAWISSTPISAMTFGRVTPVAILCNLLVIPLAFLIVMTAAVSLFAGIFLPSASALFNTVNVWFAETLVSIAETFAGLPGGSLEISPWGVGRVIAWYGAAFVVYGLLRAFLSRGDFLE